MNKKRQKNTSFSLSQPRSLRPRKRICYYVDELENSAPIGEAVEVQALHLQQENTEETVLKSASPKSPHPPLQDCTTDPLQQISLAGDTTALKPAGDSMEISTAESVPETEHIIEGAVKMSDTEQTNPANQDCKDTSGKYDMDGEETLGIQILLSSPPSPTPDAYHHHGPPPSLPHFKGVKVEDSQTASEDERCRERNPQPRLEEEDSEQQEDPGACWSDGRKNQSVKDRTRKRMGMRGLGERERRGGAKGVVTAGRRAAEQGAVGRGGNDGSAALVAAASVASSSDQPLLPSNLPSATKGGVPEETVREGDEEQLRSGDKVIPSSPKREAGSGSDLAAGETLEVGPLGGQQPVVSSEEKEKQEGGNGGSAEPDQSTIRATTPSSSSDPLKEDQQGEVWSSPIQGEVGARVGEALQPRDLGLSERCVQTESDHQDWPSPPPSEPGLEWDKDIQGQPRETLAPGGSEHNIHCAPSGKASENDDTSVRLFGAEAPGYVSDSLLNTIALLEEDEGPEGDEDATQLVCGLIKELSSLNRLVMATDRELETFRRGNKTARPPPRRVFPPRRTEI